MERRTPEEIAEHYKQKKKRRHEAFVRRIKTRDLKRRRVKRARRRRIRDRDRDLKLRRAKRPAEVAVRNIRRHKERIRRRHANGRYDWTKLSPAKQAALAALEPWNL